MYIEREIDMCLCNYGSPPPPRRRGDRARSGGPEEHVRQTRSVGHVIPPEYTCIYIYIYIHTYICIHIYIYIYMFALHVGIVRGLLFKGAPRYKLICPDLV